MEIRFGRVVTCDGSLCRAVGQQARWAWRFEKSGLGAGLNLRDRDSIQRHAGRGFTHNPMGHFCRLFNCTQSSHELLPGLEHQLVSPCRIARAANRHSLGDGRSRLTETGVF